jgi:phosphoribosyl 1,2-cyclic phosphodiesterase
LSTRQILLRLEAIGLGDAHIEGVLITHEHTDHVAGARVLSDRLQRQQGEVVPFYMTPGTAGAVRPRCRPEKIITVPAGRSFQVGPFEVEPFTIAHDTADPVAYVIRVGDTHAGVITDLGRSTRLIERQLARCALAVVEFNHDMDMLMDGPYPWALKQRVRGHHGHLSNAQAGELIRRGATSELKHLFLGHLSDENNDAEVAREAAELALHTAGLHGVSVTVAPQDHAATPRRIEAPLVFDRVLPSPRVSSSQEHAADDTSRQESLFG